MNVKGEVMELWDGEVMGMVNVRGDCFYGERGKEGEEDIMNGVDEIIEEGGGIIEIGGYC